MKKSLIALAVLAASGAAMAESSVTLYGVADVWFGQTRAETYAAPAVTGTATVAGKAAVAASDIKQTAINSGGVNGSRWGLKGTEDLGGGLKANFVLEQGYNIDTGTVGDAAASAFNRQAFVGVAGGFGAVTLGRQYTAYDALRGATNNTYDTAFATTGSVWKSGAVTDYTGRVNNSIAYTSPSFGGISGAVVVGLGENKTAAVAADQNLSLHVKYAAGPLLVGYAFQNQKAQNGKAAIPADGLVQPVAFVAVPATATVSTKYNMIAGSYDFGMAKLVAGYNTAATAGLKDKEYQLGLNFPVGASANVAIGYAKSDSDTTGAEGTGYSLAGYYDLSKRTALYAGLNKTKSKGATGVENGNTSLMAVGVRHKF